MAGRRLSFDWSIPRSEYIFIMARVSTNRSQNRYPVGTGARQLSGGEISALTSDPAAGFVETLGLISAAEGRRIMKADEKAQTIAGIAEMKRQLNTTFDEYDTNADETTYRPAYDKTFKGFNGLIKGFSNRNARTALELYKKQNAPAWENSVNDATLNRIRENAYASVENSIAGIKDLNLADVDELADANKRVEDGGAVMGSLGHSPEQVKKWQTTQYDNIRNQALYQQAENISTTQSYEEAVKFIMAKNLPVDDRNGILSNLASTERIRSAQHQQTKEQNNAQMLANFWDGTLKDPQVITDALRLGYLDDTDAKYLRAAIMNPDPPELDLISLSTVKQAIEDIGTGVGTREDALSVLYANLNSIDPATGKSLVSEIYGEHDKNQSEMKRESRDLMEELVRERDPISGMFTDDERQILGAAEAYLMLDEEIKKAAKEGKPLNRRDKMIKAIEIGRQIKKKIKAEEEVRSEPVFTPGLPPKENVLGINTMKRPMNMTEFNAAIDALPNEDARRRYFRKWYKDVPKD